MRSDSTGEDRDAERLTAGTLLVVGRRLVLFTLAVLLLLAFLKAITLVVLISLFVVILAMALNVPVTWLADHRVPRVAGTLLVEGVLLALLAGVAALVLPRLVNQITALADNVPDYFDSLTEWVAGVLGTDAQTVRDRLADASGSVERLLPTAQAVVSRIGGYTVTLFTGLILVIAVLSMTTYAVVNPKPLLRGYLRLFPAHLQDRATRAYTRCAQMVSAWVWSTMLAGAVEAVAVLLFLSLIDVPGALIWAVLAFFSEPIPKIGVYLSSVPPILVALAISPWTALITLVFYVALNELTGNVLIPPIRGRAMRVHPAVLMFAVLAMAVAFGGLGALIATPVAGFAAAFIEQFYTPRHGSRDLDDSIAQMLRAR
jgi:putative permease